MKKVKQIVKQSNIYGQTTNRKYGNLRLNFGAGDEIRTRDFLLGKQTFYH